MSLPKIWQVVNELRTYLTGFFFQSLRTTTLTIYVRANGSDTNSGLTDSTAVLTISRAAAIANTYLSANVNFVFNIGAGSFAMPSMVGDPLQGGITSGIFIIQGAGIASTTISNDFQVLGGGRYQFHDMNFAGYISVGDNTSAYFYGCKWTGKVTPSTAIDCVNGYAVIMTRVTFAGNFNYGFVAQVGGTIRFADGIPIDWDTSSPPVFTYGFLVAGYTETGAGMIVINNPVFSGTIGANSKKYGIYGNGRIIGRTKAQLDAFPGSVAGSVGGAAVHYSGQFVAGGTTAAASGYLLANGTDLGSLFARAVSTRNISLGSGNVTRQADLSLADGVIYLNHYYNTYSNYSDYGNSGGGE